jgi:hypothetical protein
VISAQRHRVLRDRCDRYETARKQFDSKRYKRGGGYSPKEQRAICKLAKIRRDVTNAERSAIELFEFCRDKPDRYFLYINEEKCVAGTWPGDVLGTVTFGREYKSPAFGGWPSTRVPVTIDAVNGCKYTGTYYKSSGNYARVRRMAERT